eukprot:gb/GEZN01013447.1/.p1 GENE.gb/GEZN01013447.1/~~gb/GEZN01013447.1/.p1  ORF type:complete len:145 (-),score=6.54 gb/GEZN01013447.1/:282-716(-)
MPSTRLLRENGLGPANANPDLPRLWLRGSGITTRPLSTHGVINNLFTKKCTQRSYNVSIHQDWTILLRGGGMKGRKEGGKKRERGRRRAQNLRSFSNIHHREYTQNPCTFATQEPDSMRLLQAASSELSTIQTDFAACGQQRYI